VLKEHTLVIQYSYRAAVPMLISGAADTPQNMETLLLDVSQLFIVLYYGG